MFYEPDKNNHGLPFNPFKSICVPRPIGWVSTISSDGIVNLAPYSQYQNLSYDPPYVMFSGGGGGGTGEGRKDSVQERDRHRRVRDQHGDVGTARRDQHHLAVRGRPISTRPSSPASRCSRR